MKAPQSSGMSNLDGSVTERLVRYYRKQAAGGAGMIIVEYAYVDDIGAKSAHCHLGISNNEHIPGLSWLGGQYPGAGGCSCHPDRALRAAEIFGNAAHARAFCHSMAKTVESVRCSGGAEGTDH